jgi:uncharacterized BrkB/YihY/UPF0761 family membrane protein
MIKVILVILGDFLFGFFGSWILVELGSAFGFIIGIMLFAVIYCCCTLNEPYDNNISN